MHKSWKIHINNNLVSEDFIKRMFSTSMLRIVMKFKKLMEHEEVNESISADNCTIREIIKCQIVGDECVNNTPLIIQKRVRDEER